MSRRLTVVGELKPMRRRRRETESEEGVQSAAVDPKPGELALARLKRG